MRRRRRRARRPEWSAPTPPGDATTGAELATSTNGACAIDAPGPCTLPSTEHPLMIGAYRLPLRFDPAPLRAEVADVARHVPWVNHWASEGDAWRIIPLLAANGGARPQPTAALERAPHVRDVLG